MRRLVVHAGGLGDQAQGLLKFVVRQSLHPDEYPAWTLTLVPVVNVRRKPSPTTQVEVANAEIRSRREPQSLLQRGQETGSRSKVVEDTRHNCLSVTPACRLVKSHQLCQAEKNVLVI